MLVVNLIRQTLSPMALDRIAPKQPELKSC